MASAQESLHKLMPIILQEESVADEMFTNFNSGVRTIFERSVSRFSMLQPPTLEMCLSLAGTSSCQELYDRILDITSFAEPFDVTSPVIVATQQENVYQLVADVKIYGCPKLLLKRETRGELKYEGEKVPLIEWMNVDINGWQLLQYQFRHRLQLVREGLVTSTDDPFFNELHLCIKLVTKLIVNTYNFGSKFDEFIDVITDGFQVMTRFQRPPRLYLSSTIDLLSTLCNLNVNQTETYYSLITETGLFPYVIGLTKDWNEILNGNDMNSSKLGQIIAAEECIRGKYDLLIAFLNFTSRVFKSESGKNCGLSSLLYILTEIFPAYRRWFYADTGQFKEIGKRCIDLFNIVLTGARKGQLNDLQRVCVDCLLEKAGGETLLMLVKEGDSNIRRQIEDVGSELVLSEDSFVLMTRNALSVLHQILALKGDNGMTAVEKVLFSSQSKPNMLLTVAHNVFQRADTTFATLSIHLLKQMAKRYPMSMLACLGSEAEAIGDHFLSKLGETTQDLRLKMALLDFLSVCTKHQPGLMEMFLNTATDFDFDDKETPSKASSSSESTNCLNTILEILEEKHDGKFYCPPELHISTVKLIYTFWSKPHILAIDLIKEKKAWNLICFPIFEDGTNDRLLGYILRILAREIYYVNALKRDKLNVDLVEIIDKLVSNGHIKTISDHIFELCNDEVKTSSDSFFLLQSWRDYLVATTKFDAMKIPSTEKTRILTNLLSGMRKQLINDDETQPNDDTLTLLCEGSLAVLNKWGETIAIEECFEHLTDVLYKVYEQRESVTFGFLICVESMLTIAVKLISTMKDSSLVYDLSDWVNPVCVLLLNCLQVVDRDMYKAGNVSEINLRITVTTLALLETLVNAVKGEATRSLAVIRKHLLLETLKALLIYLLDHHVAFGLANSVLAFFISVSRVPTGAETLMSLDLVNQTSLSIASLVSQSNSRSWLKVYFMTVQLVTSLLIELRYYFIDEAIGFVAVHADNIAVNLKKLRTSYAKDDIKEAYYVFSLIAEIGVYKNKWMETHSSSFNQINSEILKTTNSVIGFLIRPNLLQLLIDNPKGTSLIASMAASSSLLKTSSQSEDGKMKKVVSFELDTTSSLDTDLEISLLKLLSLCLTSLNKVNPNVVDVLSSQGHDDKKFKLAIDPQFGSPNIDPEKTLSFGSLLYCISLCIKVTAKTDLQTLSNKLYGHIFESSLYLLVSQGLISQLDDDIKTREKQSIGRDLHSELVSMISMVSRQSKRTSSSSLSSASVSSRNVVTKLTDKPFVKLLMKVVESVFK